MSDRLVVRLRAATGELHRQAESTPFVAALVAGQLDAYANCLMLRNLEPIYAALEDGLQRHATHPAVAPVYLPALFRSATLRDDLRVLHGVSWGQDLALMPECRRYTARLREIAADAPALMVAHAYVRYLGDLSGGQVLKEIVASSLGLKPQSPGTSFYDFGAPADVAALARRLRAGLDLSGQAAPDGDSVVQEAVDAFGMHCVLFAELADASGLPS